jgi:hypothetical protein
LSWSKDDNRKIQLQLIRLELLVGSADGILGPLSESALVEAYGDESWRKLAADLVLKQLSGALPPPGRKGERRLRWGEMFMDGLLDMTLGIGFDEGTPTAPLVNQTAARDSFVKALRKRGFFENRKLTELLYTKAGRKVPADASSRFFVKENAINWKPPVGDRRRIHAVVRLVQTIEGTKGKEVAQAFIDGMVHSDIAYYSGHGRYGSGPDFDRNFKFKLLGSDGKTVEQVIEDYSVLKQELKKEGGGKRGAWDQFKWRLKQKRIEVIGSNEGNIFLNAMNLHPGEFCANLMFWNLMRGDGDGGTLLTGKHGPLGAASSKSPERRYRVLIFDGCRSVDYNQALRATPGFNSRSADIFASTQELNWGDEGGTLEAFLDALLVMESAEQIARKMDEKQNITRHPAYNPYGTKDNPVYK